MQNQTSYQADGDTNKDQKEYPIDDLFEGIDSRVSLENFSDFDTNEEDNGKPQNHDDLGVYGRNLVKSEDPFDTREETKHQSNQEEEKSDIPFGRVKKESLVKREEIPKRRPAMMDSVFIRPNIRAQNEVGPELDMEENNLFQKDQQTGKFKSAAKTEPRIRGFFEDPNPAQASSKLKELPKENEAEAKERIDRFKVFLAM